MGFLYWAREYLRKAVEVRGNEDEPGIEGAGGGSVDDGR